MERIKLHRVIELRDLAGVDLVRIAELSKELFPALFEQFWAFATAPSGLYRVGSSGLGECIGNVA